MTKFSQFRRSVGAAAREIALYLSILRSVRSAIPGVLFFPSQGLDDGAARLRAYLISSELRSMGWRTLVCPKHLGLNARRRVIQVFCPAVILMQTTRHPLNRPALYPETPVVIDLDDADYIDPISAKPLIESLTACAGVIAGSRSVRDFCKRFVSEVAVVWTGTPPSSDIQPPQKARPSVVTWAASSPRGSSAEAAFVHAVLQRLKDDDMSFTFRMYCDDNSPEYRSFLSTLIPDGVPYETFPYLPYNAFLASLDSTAIGLAPLMDLTGFSGGKSFGKVLAYVDRSVVVVTHPVVDHPLFFRNAVSAVMCDTAEEWATAIAGLLNDPAKRQAMADAARAELCERLTTKAAADLVNRFLRRIISRS